MSRTSRAIDERLIDAAQSLTRVVDTRARVGKWDLLYRLGQGGMAEVYLARERGGLDRWVAVKKILPKHASDNTYVRMLLDEAGIAARLSHPNVVQVFEAGEEDGAPFLVMEYLHGESFSRVIRRSFEVDRTIDIDLVCRVIALACEGVHSAHELSAPDGWPMGLVHRDLSPQNLILTYDGAVKLLDFGLAKAVLRSTVTEIGILKGKCAYMSPEQARGEKLDRRSDIFSLGIVLWEATTGRRLFAGGTDLEVLARVQNGDAFPPSSRRADYPPELEAIVMRALQRRRSERFQTAREMGQALDELLATRRAVTGPARMASWMKHLFEERIRERERLLADAATEPPAGSRTKIAFGATTAQPSAQTVRRDVRRAALAALPLVLVAWVLTAWMDGGSPSDARASNEVPAERDRPAVVLDAVDEEVEPQPAAATEESVGKATRGGSARRQLRAARPNRASTLSHAHEAVDACLGER